MADLPRLNAGDLRSRRTLQARSESIDGGGAIVSTWTDVAIVWGKLKSTGVTEQLESEQSAPRQTFDYTIRRRSVALPMPLRVVGGPRTLFALAAIDDDTAIDATTLKCVEGIDLSAGSGGSSLVETVTIARGTDVVQTDRSTMRTWAPVTTDVSMRLEEADATLLQRIFGQEVTGDLHATVGIESGIRLGDGVIVTAGRHAGEQLLVTARKVDPRLPAEAYLALVLTRTTEAIG